MNNKRSKAVKVGSARVTINLPADLLRFLSTQARAEVVTMSALFRRLAAAERNRLTKGDQP